MQVHIKLACNSYPTLFERVPELPVTASDAYQLPSIGLD